MIREAIQASPRAGNSDLADKINASDAAKQAGIEVTTTEVSQQRQRMNKGGKKGKGKGKGKAAAKKAAQAAGNGRTADTKAPARQAGPVELIDRVFSLAQECGGLKALKHLVDRLAEARAH
jgi:hypothetical protein